MKDIFDTDNLDDIPEDIKQKCNFHPLTSKVLDLFKQANRPLTISEVRVALYRVYQYDGHNRTVHNAITHLTTKGLVQRTATRGQYQLTKEERD